MCAAAFVSEHLLHPPGAWHIPWIGQVQWLFVRGGMLKQSFILLLGFLGASAESLEESSCVPVQLSPKFWFDASEVDEMCSGDFIRVCSRHSCTT